MARGKTEENTVTQTLAIVDKTVIAAPTAAATPTAETTVAVAAPAPVAAAAEGVTTLPVRKGVVEAVDLKDAPALPSVALTIAAKEAPEPTPDKQDATESMSDTVLKSIIAATTKKDELFLARNIVKPAPDILAKSNTQMQDMAVFTDGMPRDSKSRAAAPATVPAATPVPATASATAAANEEIPNPKFKDRDIYARALQALKDNGLATETTKAVLGTLAAPPTATSARQPDDANINR
jgi:hypothetical protein